MKNDDEKLTKKNLKKKTKNFFYPLKKTCFVLPYEIFFFFIYFFSFKLKKKDFFLAQSLSFCFSLFFIRSGVSLSFHLVRCFVCVCTTLPFFFSFFLLLLLLLFFLFVSCL
jgi:hypothetical protein